MVPPWMVLGAAAFLAAAAAFAVAFRRSDRSRSAFAAGCLNLLIAGLNSSAPFRGLLDPQYVGYRNGLLSASQGVDVLLIAGAVLVCASAAAFIAARNRPGSTMFVVAVIDGAFALNEAISLLRSARGARDFEIQFGEFLTIPSDVGLVINLLILLLLVATIFWALARARPQQVLPA
jgi:hypothetical protein